MFPSTSTRRPRIRLPGSADCAIGYEEHARRILQLEGGCHGRQKGLPESDSTASGRWMVGSRDQYLSHMDTVTETGRRSSGCDLEHRHLWRYCCIRYGSISGLKTGSTEGQPLIHSSGKAQGSACRARREWHPADLDGIEKVVLACKGCSQLTDDRSGSRGVVQQDEFCTTRRVICQSRRTSSVSCHVSTEAGR
jgi:hypothetical protein